MEDTLPGYCGKLHTADVSRGPTSKQNERETHEEQLFLKVERHSGLVPMLLNGSGVMGDAEEVESLGTLHHQFNGRPEWCKYVVGLRCRHVVGPTGCFCTVWLQYCSRHLVYWLVLGLWCTVDPGGQQTS